MSNSPRLARLPSTDYELPAGVATRLFSPSLVVFVDKVRANVRQMLAHMGGDPGRWRPHLKTTKTPEIWRELVDAGVRHFKCATPREAEMLTGLLAEMGRRGSFSKC